MALVCFELKKQFGVRKFTSDFWIIKATLSPVNYKLSAGFLHEKSRFLETLKTEKQWNTRPQKKREITCKNPIQCLFTKF